METEMNKEEYLELKLEILRLEVESILDNAESFEKTFIDNELQKRYIKIDVLNKMLSKMQPTENTLLRSI
jgi:hypothetical protein